jgi:hypothetical protein
MSNYVRVVSAALESVSEADVDDPIIELTCPANAMIEIIRVEIGPAEGASPVDEVQELALWMGTIAGTGGSAMTETILRGDGTISGSALSSLTALGTGNIIYATAYHTQNGWLYLPVPEERPQLIGGGDDIFNLHFPTVPDAALVSSTTIVWGEVA